MAALQNRPAPRDAEVRSRPADGYTYVVTDIGPVGRITGPFYNFQDAQDAADLGDGDRIVAKLHFLSRDGEE